MVIGQKITDTVARLEEAANGMPKMWDGRRSILEMKNAGGRQWRQMEWMGFYFEFLCQNAFSGILEMPGMRYGKAEFDAFGTINWDFKAHAVNTTSRRVITNDKEAVESAVSEHGHYGLIIAVGKVEYNDEERSFKRWHDALKGGKSDYELNRIARGAASRLRKTEFVLEDIQFLCLDADSLDQCGGSFQQGFRNSDGNPRRPKVTIDVRKIPDESIVSLKNLKEL